MASNAYIARQPIVDGKHQLIAYELLFRDSHHSKNAVITDSHNAGIQVISNTLFNMGADWLLKGKLAFINMDEATLMSDFSSLLPHEKAVIEVLESVEPTGPIVERLKELKQAGFRIALDDFTYRPELEPLLALASYVKFDVMAHPAADIAKMVQVVRRHPVKLLAEKVETRAEFDHYKTKGFELFQGYYFAHPENLSAKVVNPSQATVMQLMEKVRQEADIKQIEEGFKRDVALTFKLLRYINSAGFGLACEVQSIRHAVNILGYKPLYKWLTLLLVTATNSATAPVLSRTAVTRGRMCELIGAIHLPRNELDNLFITGVFSLLDALLESPMEQILERVNIPESIADALLNRTGMYGPILALVEACEKGDPQQIEMLTDSLILSPEQVNDAHLQALAWVEQLGID